MAYLLTWDDAYCETPVSEDIDIHDVDDHIRNLKQSIRERFETWQWDSDFQQTHTLISPLLKYFAEVAITSTGVSGTYDCDISDANIYRLTLDGDVTLTFSHPAPTGYLSVLTLIITQTSTGDATITFPAHKHEGIYPEIWGTKEDTESIWYFFTVDGGTTWYSHLAGTNIE